LIKTLNNLVLKPLTFIGSWKSPFCDLKNIGDKKEKSKMNKENLLG